MATGDAEEVIDLLQPVVSAGEDSSEALHRYGAALLMDGKASRAVWPLQRAAEGAEPDSEVARLHAQALLMGGDPESAIRLLDELLDQVPDEPPLLGLRAVAYQRSLALDEAIADLDVLLELNPMDVRLHENRIRLLIEVERIDDARAAVDAYRRHLETSGSAEARARFCASAATFEHQYGEIEAARALFGQCLERFPAHPDVVLAWQLFLDESGDPEAATEALEAAAAGAGKRRPRIRLALANRLASMGRREDATTALRDAAEELQAAQPLFALADLQVSWGDLTAAEATLDEAIEMQTGVHPTAEEFDWARLPEAGRFAFADILIQVGRYERAEDVIASLQAESVEEPAYATILEGRLALVRGDPSAALALFEESFKRWPSNVGARFLAAQAAMQLGEFESAISFYQDAFRAEPAGAGMAAGLVVARMQLAQGQKGAALDTLNTLITESPNDPEALRLFASLASQAGARETAEGARDDLANRIGWVDEVLADRAMDLRSLDGREAALAYLAEESGFGDPSQHEAWFAWFLLRAEGGETEQLEAREVIRKRSAEAPESGPAAYVLCRVDQHMGRPLAESIEACRSAIERDPELVEAGATLGRLLVESDDLDGARREFERVLELDPGNFEAAVGRADVAFSAGEIDAAETFYKDIAIESPWYGLAAGALARMAFDRGDLSDETVTWARWAARFNDVAPMPASLLLAEIRLARGEPTEAAAVLHNAMQNSGDPSPWPSYLLGRAYADMGRQARAIESLEEALGRGEFSAADDARELLARLMEGEVE